jgi:hypothetical protein
MRITKTLAGALAIVLGMSTAIAATPAKPVAPALADTVDVTFQVNMAVQIFETKFDPNSDAVKVNGSFNGWGASTDTLSVASDSIYAKTIALAAGDTVEYKFFYQHNGTDIWEADNRSLIVPDSATTLDLVWFDNDSEYNEPLGPLVTSAVTFQVDMSDYIARGVFTDDDTLVVRGPFNGWGGYTHRLLSSFGNPGVYTLTDSLTLNEGSDLVYKYVMKLAGFGDVWENLADNRTAEFTSGSLDLPLALPNFSDPRPLDVESDVTFMVNMKPFYRKLAAEGFVTDIQTGDTLTSFTKLAIAGPSPPLNDWLGDWNLTEADSIWEFNDDGVDGDEAAGDSIWSATFTFGDSIPREFPYKYGPDGFDVEAGFGNNHLAQLQQESSQVIMDVFGSIDSSLYGAYTFTEDFPPVPVTFHVDMNVQRDEGNFDPDSNQVWLRGDFNGWGADDTMSDSDGDLVYTLEFPVPPKEGSYNYKFFFKKTDGTDVWEDDPARSLTVGAETEPFELPTAFFNRDSVVSVFETANLTFQVDMSEYINRGVFTASDTLVVRGPFNGWGGYTHMLTSSFGNPSLYALTSEFTAETGADFIYKFVMKLSGVEGDVWETFDGNREVVWTGSDITLDPVTPVFQDPRPVSKDLVRTFVVNTKPLWRRLADVGFVVNQSGGDTLTSISTISLAGPAPPLNNWLNEWAWDSDSTNWDLNDDGTDGDEVAGDSLFSKTFVFPAGSPRGFEFKFGGDYLDVEAGFAKNHSLEFTDDDTASIFSVWGSPDTLYAAWTTQQDFEVSVEPLDGPLPVEFALQQNYPNPFNPETTILFDVAKPGRVEIAVYNILGQQVAVLVDKDFTAGSYKATWNATNRAGVRVPSGMYIYKMVSGDFTRTMKMILMK